LLAGPADAAARVTQVMTTPGRARPWPARRRPPVAAGLQAAHLLPAFVILLAISERRGRTNARDAPVAR